MEAFISRISAEGPSVNLPPHILLELPLRPVIACLPGLGALLAALLSAGCDRQKAAEPQGGGPAANQAGTPGGQRYPTGRLDRSRAGTRAPDVQFEDPEGEPADFADFRGRPLLVNLWATWCAPCVVEMPSLDRLAAREGERVQVLALSQDIDGRQKVTDFFAARRFGELEPYLDGDLAVMTALRIDTLPTTILYDAEGREVWRMTGMAEWDGERARRLLAEAERAAN
ncbi:MAG TPA: TlpA disulfide reductase family protein [Allosphingosinicella sp.]|jgi:thiol-disulfide isomerase/thioredoxin